MKRAKLVVAVLLAMQSAAFAAGSTVMKPAPKNPERDLIRRTERPENYETPLEDLDSLYTPSEKFFVRSHLPVISDKSAEEWVLKLEGEGFERPLTLTIAQLKKDFAAVEIPAVAMCAGNRRSEFQPRVPGVQWGKGAIGNGLWKGVRLKDVLEKAGVKSGTIEISFNGADLPVLPATPDFVKSIPLARALDESTLLAYELNGKPLPRSNGFPLRLVIPGWVASYWIKQVESIQALSKPSDSFWMQKAYRIEKGKFPAVEKGFASQENEKSAPISELVVNSLITNLQEGQKIRPGREMEVRGWAWDGGHGISKVEVSVDGGATWTDAGLEGQVGPYSWRRFSHRFTPARDAHYAVMSRATSTTGQVQPEAAVSNGPGYHNNAIPVVHLESK